MLSKDELKHGTTFILKLTDANGLPAQWVESLCGEAALRWYEIYQKSDWQALRAQGPEVFHHRVTEAEAERVRKSGRCVVIHTPAVKAEEIAPSAERALPLQPDWENDGGSLAPIVSSSAHQAAPIAPMVPGAGTT